MIDEDKAIATAVKTGKVIFGTNEAIRSIKNGKARLIIMASNIPSQIRGDLEYYGSLSSIPVVTYRGNNIDLGMVCGRLFAVATLTIKEAGDSEILKLAGEAKKEQEIDEEETEEL